MSPFGPAGPRTSLVNQTLFSAGHLSIGDYKRQLEIISDYNLQSISALRRVHETILGPGSPSRPSQPSLSPAVKWNQWILLLLLET